MSSPPLKDTREATPSGTSANVEARKAVRRPAAAVPSISGLRISPHGLEAALVDISASGLLAECDEALKPGSQLTVSFEGGFLPSSVEGRVARTAVASITSSGKLRYHVGIAFKERIAVLDKPSAPSPTPSVLRNRW